MSKSTIIFTGISCLILISIHGPAVLAQKEAGTFGKFEVGLPGIDIESETIDSFVNKPEPILNFINLAVNTVIAVLVIIGLITTVIGGYIYMTAGGDASKVKTAKEMIIAALLGIFLSLISVVVLNTINVYIGSKAKEPTLNSAPKSGSSPSSNNSTTNTPPENSINTATKERIQILESDIARRNSLRQKLQDGTITTTERGYLNNLEKISPSLEVQLERAKSAL